MNERMNDIMAGLKSSTAADHVLWLQLAIAAVKFIIIISATLMITALCRSINRGVIVAAAQYSPYYNECPAADVNAAFYVKMLSDGFNFSAELSHHDHLRGQRSGPLHQLQQQYGAGDSMAIVHPAQRHAHGAAGPSTAARSAAAPPPPMHLLTTLL
jgi:hypothetical protein